MGRPAFFIEDELARGLVLIYQSNNAHMWANYTLQDQRVNEYCEIPAAKEELVKMLRRMADDIEKNYPYTVED